MVDCVIEQTAHRKQKENGWYSYPFGILVYHWLLYYYPLFENPTFIPQKNGETPELKKGRTIAFRREFNKIIKNYRGKGGLPQFRYDLIHNNVDEDHKRDVIELLRKLQHTIKGMPMKHLGYSIFNEHYSLVDYDTSTIKTPSYYDLINEAGSFSIHPDLHHLIDEVGSLLIGQDSIIQGWADFTYQVAKRNSGTAPLKKERILSVLTKAVDIPRDQGKVKSILRSEAESEFKCIWTGKALKGTFHVDHIIPYSLWQNNNLWNLVPVTSTINSQKTDRIPSPTLIQKSAPRIKSIWNLYANSFGNQFNQELFEGLGTYSEDGFDVAINSLKQKSEYLIEKRGFQKFEIN
jgi:hypothetical protein